MNSSSQILRNPLRAICASVFTLLLTACPTLAPQADAQTNVATTTSLSASPNPVYVSQLATLTATVTANSGTTVPTGQVNFLYGNTLVGAALLNSSGVATLTQNTSTLLPGEYILYAVYIGTTGFSASQSGNVQVSLGQVTTSTKLTASSTGLTPPATDTLTATVTRTTSGTTGYASGTVSFNYGSVSLGTATLNASGVATLTASSKGVPGGTYAITATYNGDLYDKPSTAAAVSVEVAGNVAITVSVNPLANRHAISPLIYGTNFPENAAYITATNSTFARWAGDASTGYNWTNYATNLASDYFFANYPFNSTNPFYASSQTYVSGVASTGAAPFIAIGMIPWVAKDSTSYSYSVAKYGPQCATAEYHPDLGDGIETNCATDITTNDPTDAYTPLEDQPESGDAAGTVYRNQWVQALASQFGSGMHIYGIDNEPEIWGGVHRDVHPNPTTYAEMRTLMVDEIPNIKAWDPKATVAGVGSCGWYYYWNGGTGSDKASHANLDYNPWLLNEMVWADKVSGTRGMDWYDLHAYPDGNETGYTAAQTQALALRVLRDFWDPNYLGEGPDVDQIYVTNLQPNREYAFRIPRMRALINTIYPGTPLTFSEWNAALAGETDYSTVLVDVDAWGIFGVNELYAASRWTASATTSPAYYSLLLYRNYDGQNHTFGTTSIQTTNTGDPSLFSSYAALNSTGTQLTVILSNKDPLNTNVVTLSGNGFNPTSLSTYTLTQSNPGGILAATGLTPTRTFTLPPYTAVLLVMNGTLAQTPAAEWALNPDAIMVPAGGTVTLAPTITSGTGTITLSNAVQTTLSNPASTAGFTATITNPTVTAATSSTAASNGAITLTAGVTPGFYQLQVTGTDENGVAVTQQGWVLVQNQSATLTKTAGDGQTAAPGATLTLTATLGIGNSGGSLTGADIFFTASAGTLSAREVEVNSSGQATVTLTLPANAGPVTVTAEGQYGLGHPVVTFNETVN